MQFPKLSLWGLKYFADPENELAAMEYWEMGTLGNTTAAKVMTVFPLILCRSNWNYPVTQTNRNAGIE